MLVHGMTPELFYGNYVPDSSGRLYASRRPARLPVGVGRKRAFRHQYRESGADGIGGRASGQRGGDRRAPPDAAVQEYGRSSRARNSDAPRLGTGGNYIWTLRATARLRRPDGSPSDVVRTAAAVVKLVDRAGIHMDPVHILRWYDDAWSESAIAPPDCRVMEFRMP